jgi:hypothetical protein
MSLTAFQINFTRIWWSAAVQGRLWSKMQQDRPISLSSFRNALSKMLDHYSSIKREHGCGKDETSGRDLSPRLKRWGWDSWTTREDGRPRPRSSESRPPSGSASVGLGAEPCPIHAAEPNISLNSPGNLSERLLQDHDDSIIARDQCDRWHVQTRFCADNACRPPPPVDLDKLRTFSVHVNVSCCWLVTLFWHCSWVHRKLDFVKEMLPSSWPTGVWG